ncbi:MAG: response regulator transcription factor, partial [Actinomycetota bacterium]
ASSGASGRVLLVDDQEIVRIGIARVLTLAGFTVARECTDGDQVLAALEQVDVDVVLLDVRMPGRNGLQVLDDLAGSGRAEPVLVLTTFDDDEAVWGALDRGAAGFALKSASTEEIVLATQSVIDGRGWLDPRIADRVMRAARPSMVSREHARLLDHLTPRERDILTRIARGAINAEIAAELYLAETTVKSHITSLFAKIGARDRAAAIVFAFESGVAGEHRRP